jgi:hypothetical protein
LKNELRRIQRRQSHVYYHIDGLNNAECLENICNPGSIEWAAGVEFHRRCVEVSCNPDSKYKWLRLTREVDGDNKVSTLTIWDRVSIWK